MKVRLIAVAAVLAFAVSSCGGDDTTPTGGTTAQDTSQAGGPVVIKATDDLKFEPASVTIKAGTTVSWQNTGSLPHTVTFPTHDKPLNANGTLVYSFSQAGTISYACKIHPTMKGTIVVS